MKQQSSKNTDDEQMKRAYNLGSKLVRDRLEKEDKENIEILDEMKSDDIIVIRGTYDHIHLVLENSKIEFQHLDPEDISSIKLRPDQTIFVNCASSFEAEIARKLATFVGLGGQLITTDWALKNVLEVGFPGIVEYNGKNSADEVVRIEIVAKDDPILKGFIDEEADPLWWLEGSSYPIHILDKEKVRVLVRSKELGEKYGDDAVIISFNHGEGVVYHMISHFYLQRTEVRDAKQAQKSSVYASAKGASAETQALFEEAEAEMPDLNYSKVQSASTSSEFINRAVISQKKKFRKKKK